MSPPNPPAPRAGSALLRFIGLSAVAGLLVTAAATPAVAIAGLTASGSIGLFESLPDYLDIGHLAQKSTIYAKGDNNADVPIATFFTQNREEVPASEMSPWFEAAAISGEDNDFLNHSGVNLGGTVRAFLATLTGQGAQGGSGITQQLAKNLLVEKAEANPDPAERDKQYAEATGLTIDRKLKEVKFAIGIEKKFSKSLIMNKYLNVFYAGANVYGAEAASMYYFGVHAKNATAFQAATIIAILNNPEVLRIDRPSDPDNGAANGYERTRDRRNHILGLMVKYNRIGQDAYDEAVRAPVAPVITQTKNGCESAPMGSAFACDYVKHVFLNDPAYGPDSDARFATFRRGGYEIYTTLDLRLQQTAHKEIEHVIPKVIEGRDVAGTSVSVEVGTGRILQMVQSKDFTEDSDLAETGRNYTSLNYNADKDFGGSSGFSPGSTYKIFTLAEWLSKGHTITEEIDGRKRNWAPMNDKCTGTYTGEYDPKNDDGSSGGMSNAKIATEQSVNTTYMAMAKKLDLCEIKERAEKFLMHRADGKPLEHYPASVIGSNEVAPIAIATAMAGFANGGKTCSPIAIDKILLPDKSEAPTPKSECSQSVDPTVATEANVALDGVMKNGTGRKSRPSDGTPMIGKSGTAEDNFGSWMTTSSPRVATSSWVGNVAEYQGNKSDLRSFDIAGVKADQARHVYTKPIVEAANRLYPGGSFPVTRPKSQPQPRDDQLTVPDLRGASAATAESTLEGLGFEPIEGDEVNDSAPAGTVAQTDPPAGASVAKGSSVTYQLSSGKAGSAVPNVVGKSVDVALAQLSAAGYTPRVQDVNVTEAAKDNLVARTDPAAGAHAKEGATVIVVKNKYRPGPAPDPNAGPDPALTSPPATAPAPAPVPLPVPGHQPGHARPRGRIRPHGRSGRRGPLDHGPQ